VSRRMIQLTIWDAQSRQIPSHYSKREDKMMKWVDHLGRWAEEMVLHGRRAELRYAKNGEVCMWVDEVAQTGIG
jgi:hypothetical protein